MAGGLGRGLLRTGVSARCPDVSGWPVVTEPSWLAHLDGGVLTAGW